MKRSRFAIVIAIGAFLATAQCLAASPAPSADPLAAIDLNRTAIIADIVKSFEAYAGDDTPGASVLKARLEKLRADRLLAASLASSRATLDAILAEADSPKLPAFSPLRAKSLGDPNRDLLYTPLTPCRLIDTRGNGAPFQGGAFAPGERRAYVPAGGCGIPTSGVATMLISFTTQNLTPGSGGVLAILAPAAPFTATVDVFNLGSSWSASNTAVATGSAGQFDVFVLIANAHVIVDVLGYFGPMQGNITLVDSTATTGNILKGSVPFIHNFGINNTFVGEYAGNFTMAGDFNTAIGVSSLKSNAAGGGNTASGAFALTSNTSGNYNTASGTDALNRNTTGANNTATGNSALFSNTTGSANTAIGSGALISNTTGYENTGSGFSALLSNVGGFYNTATGSGALSSNTLGYGNTASGRHALFSNTTGQYNTANGTDALRSSTAGNQNTAYGFNSLFANTTGDYNTATGASALDSNTTGQGNTASGVGVMEFNTTGNLNTALGFQALNLNTAGSNNIAIGASAGQNLTSGNYNVYIGSLGGFQTESGTIRIGQAGDHTRTYLAGVYGVVVSGSQVLVNNAGQLGIAVSSRRFKDDIADMDTASSALMKLRPVTFRYKTDSSPTERTLQYGLIAEEVAEVYPGLVARSAEGLIETVMYQFLPPMLLNEYQKQQKKIDAQMAHLARQTEEIAGLKAAVAEVAELKQQMAHMARLLEQHKRADSVTAGLGIK